MRYLLLILLLTNVCFAKDPKDFKSNKEWLIEVNKGNVKNHDIVHKFGENDNVGTTLVPVTSDGIYQTPTTLISLEIISSSTNDAAAGSGARTVTIYGINDTNGSWTEDEETITMNGTTAVASTKTWRRIFRMKVVTSGTYATSAAPSHNSTITLRVSGAGATWATINTENSFGFGVSQIGAYTIPKGKKGILLVKHIFVDATKPATVLFFVRANADTVSAPFGPMRVTEVQHNVTEHLTVDSKSGEDVIMGPADIGFMASLSSGTGSVEVEFELLVISN